MQCCFRIPAQLDGFLDVYKRQVSVLTRLGEGIRDLMFMVSDNELYCAHLKKMYDCLLYTSRCV